MGFGEFWLFGTGENEFDKIKLAKAVTKALVTTDKKNIF